jgi:hypothetical protein
MRSSLKLLSRLGVRRTHVPILFERETRKFTEWSSTTPDAHSRDMESIVSLHGSRHPYMYHAAIRDRRSDIGYDLERSSELHIPPELLRMDELSGEFIVKDSVSKYASLSPIERCILDTFRDNQRFLLVQECTRHCGWERGKIFIKLAC